MIGKTLLGKAGSGVTSGVGVAKVEEGGSVSDTDASVNEVAGWRNKVSNSSGMVVGGATSKDSDCEVLKKLSVNGVEVTDGCICDVLIKK